jgi:deoxynucleoside triphosphate triphosphohydrolase SAMHD1
MKLLAKHQPELGITDTEVRNVAIAGLCHDLGHGPFSHVFDNQFIRKLQHEQKHGKHGVVDTDGKPTDGETWCHEKASTMMFRHIVD